MGSRKYLLCVYVFYYIIFFATVGTEFSISYQKRVLARHRMGDGKC